MTDTVRLTDLPAASALADADLVPVVQSGSGRRATVAQFRAGLSGGSGLPWATVPTGTTITVDANRQMMVFNSLTLDGSLVVDGSVGVWN